jgi:PKD repeat protein
MKLYVDGAVVGADPQIVARSYTGYWRIGGDSTPNQGTTDDGFTGRIDEAAVYDKVLTEAQVVSHLALGGGQAPNQPPDASFTVGVNGLQVSLNAQASDDPDGNIVSWDWDFGDDETGSGETVNHTYDGPGTYTIELTVTDNDGGIDVTTQDVTVNAPPVNQAPTASFTVTPTGLQVTVNGSASSDPDGNIVSYSWNFGDGGTDTGATPAPHTYAAPGPYTITLTVVDDDGAPGVAQQNINVSTVIVLAADAFGRTVPSGFGTADTGGSWSHSGSVANFAVNGGAGRITLPTPNLSRAATLAGANGGNVELAVDLSMDQSPAGGGVYWGAVVRKVGNSEYRLRMRVRPGITNLQLLRVSNGAETVLESTTLAGVDYTANSVAHFRFRATGSGTTTLQGRVWFDGQSEPGTWQIQATDSTAGSLQGPGGVGVHAYLTSSTNATVMSVDNLTAQQI